ncbi:MAG: hypothetical protein ACYC5M_11715 [Anaerolineae bacterium]
MPNHALHDTFDKFGMAGRFARGLAGFLRHRLSPQECRLQIQRQLAGRTETFLEIVSRAIYDQHESPYLALLRHAGVRYEDVAQLVGQHGVEGALERLYEAGVYVTLEEFKGRKPIQRGSLYLAVEARDFDNPLPAGHFVGRTGGSRSGGTRLVIDLDDLAYEAAYEMLLLETYDLQQAPLGLWRPAPPGAAGIKNLLRRQKLGRRTERWFSQSEVTFRDGQSQNALFVYLAVVLSRLYGNPIAMPEYVPVDQAYKVARWMAAKCAEGVPPMLDTNVSTGVRVCKAARDEGLDISGSFFRVGSEPFTPGKAQAYVDAGVRAACNYSMAEAGRLGLPCANPAAVDEVHLMHDKLGIVTYHRPALPADCVALSFTTLLPTMPKLLLNMQSGDYGVLERRACGCHLEALGFERHLHTVRSIEKLTTEGMHFVGSDLISLLEEVLPARFGGDSTDYQLVEEEVDGLTRVSIVVSPRVGAVDDESLVTVALQHLGAHNAATRMMADYWQSAHSLRVVRREPHVTQAGKILSLHVIRPPQ